VYNNVKNFESFNTIINAPFAYIHKNHLNVDPVAEISWLGDFQEPQLRRQHLTQIPITAREKRGSVFVKEQRCRERWELVDLSLDIRKRSLSSEHTIPFDCSHR
jgi:hypothetical protein